MATRRFHVLRRGRLWQVREAGAHDRPQAPQGLMLRDECAALSVGGRRAVAPASMSRNAADWVDGSIDKADKRYDADLVQDFKRCQHATTPHTVPPEDLGVKV